MMGEPYSAIAAREVLEREIGARTPEAQAEYWAQAALDTEYFFWNGTSSPLTGDLQGRGLIERGEGRHTHYPHIHQRLRELLPFAAPCLVALAAGRASNVHHPYHTNGSDKLPADHAEHLLRTLESIALKGDWEAVPEETINQLVELMHRLWPDYKVMRSREERTGFCLQYVVRALHALRPRRFPRLRQNPRDSGEFNVSDHGLD